MSSKAGKLPKRPTAKSLQFIANMVKKKFNTLPIAVSYGNPGRGHVGSCSLDYGQVGPHFEVVIHHRLRDHTAVMGVFEHELAHCLAWFDPTNRHPHGGSWGLACSTVYQFLYKVR